MKTTTSSNQNEILNSPKLFFWRGMLGAFFFLVFLTAAVCALYGIAWLFYPVEGLVFAWKLILVAFIAIPLLVGMLGGLDASLHPHLNFDGDM